MANNPARPALDDLAVFLAVARAGGFRQAARQLAGSPAMVSETVSRLEARLGVPLFNRTTRSVVPTDAGRALAARLEPLLAQAAAAVDEAMNSGAAVRGTLKLNVPGAVMVDILPPLVDRFLVRHPEVAVEIVVDDRFVDAVATGCHAGIRYGEHLAEDVIAVPIGPRRQQAALAAAPAYLARRGAPAHPREVLAHDCIRNRFASGALTAWEFEQEGEILALDPPARLVVGTAGVATAIGHAVAGRGLIMTFRNWLEPHFDSGVLVPVLADWWPAFDGPRLYFSSRLMPAPLRAFVDLVAEARREAEAG